MLRAAGYHSDAKSDAKLIKKMVKPNALKRARGGSVAGEEPKARPDKRARGGAMRKGAPHTVVNVVSGHGAGGGGPNPQALQAAQQAGMRQGIQTGARLGARAAAQKMGAPGGMRPPMGGPPPGGPPMMPGGGGPPLVPPPGIATGGAIGRARGGSVDKAGEPPETIRKESFSGDDDKHMPPFPKQDQAISVKAHTRRRSGGRCE